jgi:hypothetical protein
MAVLTVPAALWLFPSMKLALVPVVTAVCWQLVFCALLHLYPWQSVAAEELVCRLDRLGVVLITLLGFTACMMLPCGATCSPSPLYFLFLVACPNFISARMILRGAKRHGRPDPLVFIGVLVSCVAMGLRWASTREYDLLAGLLGVTGLDALGMAVYLAQIGGQARIWGYHEWMHVSVGVGFYINIYLVALIADRCNQVEQMNVH